MCTFVYWTVASNAKCSIILCLTNVGILFSMFWSSLQQLSPDSRPVLSNVLYTIRERMIITSAVAPPIVGRCCPRSCAHSDSVDHRVSSCPRESADGVQGSVHTQGTYDQHVSRCARESVDVFQGFVNTPRTYDHHVRSCLPITCRWFPKGLCTLRERTISTSIVVSRESADGFPRFCAHSENGKSSRHQLSPESRPMFAQVLCTLRGWIITTSTIVSERRPTTLH